MSKNKITTGERCDIWSLLSLEELIQPFYFDLAHHSKDQRGNIGEKFFSFREKHRSAAAKLISWCWHCTTGSTAWRGKAGGGGEGEVGGGVEIRGVEGGRSCKVRDADGLLLFKGSKLKDDAHPLPMLKDVEENDVSFKIFEVLSAGRSLRRGRARRRSLSAPSSRWYLSFWSSWLRSPWSRLTTLDPPSSATLSWLLAMVLFLIIMLTGRFDENTEPWDCSAIWLEEEMWRRIWKSNFY